MDQNQVPKTNSEWIDYYQQILEELKEEEKNKGNPISVDEFADLPIKRKQKYLKKLFNAISE